VSDTETVLSHLAAGVAEDDRIAREASEDSLGGENWHVVEIP
jgi:hypothetical protein